MLFTEMGNLRRDYILGVSGEQMSVLDVFGLRSLLDSPRRYYIINGTYSLRFRVGLILEIKTKEPLVGRGYLKAT